MPFTCIHANHKNHFNIFFFFDRKIILTLGSSGDQKIFWHNNNNIKVQYKCKFGEKDLQQWQDLSEFPANKDGKNAKDYAL